jgi:hypothetical protein
MTRSPIRASANPAKRRTTAVTDGLERAGARAMLGGTGFTDGPCAAIS